MNKIPVGATIASAYRFTFGGFGTVIGLIWLPLVLYTFGRYFIVDYYAEGLARSGDPTEAGRALLVLMGFSLVSVFFTAVIGVALTRQVMAPKHGSVIMQFAIGPAELNYFLSLLAVFAVLIAAYFAILIADIPLGFLSDGIAAILGPHAGGKVVGLASLAVIVLLDFTFLIAGFVRLAFLVAPVTVAEGKVDLVRAWQLGKGNFWRMLLVALATLGPIFIVGLIAYVVIVGPGWVAALATTMLKLFEVVASGGTPPTAALNNLPDIAQKAPLLVGLSFLLAPFSYGLMFAAPAFAYRALVGRVLPGGPPDMGPLRPA